MDMDMDIELNTYQFTALDLLFDIALFEVRNVVAKLVLIRIDSPHQCFPQCISLHLLIVEVEVEEEELL